ncbi:MAG: hypothetical protein NDI63_14645 [Pseudobdellovibrio sp.]|nr:hypothetical protein [Pseudobdellovibrio sp.]
MNFKKIALGVIGIVIVLALGYFVKQNSSNTRKICTPAAEKVICQECTCPMGQPIPTGIMPAPGVNAFVACPDGATPTCKEVEK